jgi:hypothetical protein
MEFDKQYLSQLISVSANNLRLSSEKIEAVGLLKEMLLNPAPLEDRLKHMKKVTEFAKLAIRLSEIYNYLHQNRIDFLAISDKFKEQSTALSKEIGAVLDSGNITQLKSAIFKVESFLASDRKDAPAPQKELPVFKPVHVEEEKITEILREEEDFPDELSFSEYESAIMKPIKNLDSLFKRIGNEEIHHEEYTNFAKVLLRNAALSDKFGTDIISNMLRIVAKSLLLIRGRELMPGKEIIEAMRACLIVIVALVKNKEVDISVYLNKAEDFSRKIKMIKVKE